MLQIGLANRAKKAQLSTALPTMIEFACHPDSMLGNVAMENNIDSIRLSQEFSDLSTLGGYNAARVAIDSAVKPIHLHGSLPCTPWTGWQSFNIVKCGEAFHKRLQIDRQNSIVMLDYFYKLAKKVILDGGTISFEWPRYCAGWDLPTLVQLISDA